MTTPDHPTSQTPYTAAGIFALVFWSTTIACSRSVSESAGFLTAAATVHLLGGLFGFLVVLCRRQLGELRKLTPRYLLGCGIWFVLYNGFLYTALGMAADRQQAVEVSLINYLWPGLTLVFSVPLLRLKARWGWLLLGIAISLGGIAVLNDLSIDSLVANAAGNPLAYGAALGCAISWGLYSSLNQRWSGETGAATVPLLLVVSGVILLLMRLPRLPLLHPLGPGHAQRQCRPHRHPGLRHPPPLHPHRLRLPRR
ncbi:MAG: EamA family transporter [Planctomycetota bacterium]|jgi:drug/metabolite transporter (DMT)-like permease